MRNELSCFNICMNTLFAQTLESGDVYIYMEEKERKGKKRKEGKFSYIIHRTLSYTHFFNVDVC